MLACGLFMVSLFMVSILGGVVVDSIPRRANSLRYGSRNKKPHHEGGVGEERPAGRLGWLGGCLPPLLPAVARPTVGAKGDGSQRR
jgi:hypothetical protein